MNVCPTSPNAGCQFVDLTVTSQDCLQRKSLGKASVYTEAHDQLPLLAQLPLLEASGSS